MQQLIRINEIKRRAEAIGSSLKAACDAAGVKPANAYRWLGEGANPCLGTYDTACKKLEAWLDTRELALLAELGARHYPRMQQQGRAAA